MNVKLGVYLSSTNLLNNSNNDRKELVVLYCYGTDAMEINTRPQAAILLCHLIVSTG